MVNYFHAAMFVLTCCTRDLGWILTRSEACVRHFSQVFSLISMLSFGIAPNKVQSNKVTEMGQLTSFNGLVSTGKTLSSNMTRTVSENRRFLRCRFCDAI